MTIGAFSYGSCFIGGQFPPGVTIGRYVSLAGGISVFLRNHPTTWLSTHPFFFNAKLGFIKEDPIKCGTLYVGHDAWVGEQAIILPGCGRIGVGAVVGAGAVVTKDVPDFAIVAGVPACVIKYRFSEGTRQKVLAGRWWDRPIQEITNYMDAMIGPLEEGGPCRHPLLAHCVGSTQRERYLPAGARAPTSVPRRGTE